MSASTSTPKWILPQVANWDFLQKQFDVKNRQAVDWKGTVVFINEEGRHINITVQWMLGGIQQMPDNANRLRGKSPGTLVPPNFLNNLKALTEHYAVEEAGRLGALEVRIMATIHDFTQGTGVKDAQPDPLHVTCHIKTAEWGQKKVHVYLEGYERLAKPVASVVFVKDHHTLGAGNKTGINPLDFRAFWHPNLSYGRLPSWLSATGASAENPGGKPSMKLDAKATWQYIDARAKEFPAAVEQTEKLPLKPLITSIVDGHMYTRFSQIVKKDFGAGQGQTQQMDYKTGKWYQMAQDSKTKRWSRVQPPPPGAGAGGSKK